MSCCSSCQTMGGVDGGVCDQAFVLTWPSDVDRLKAQLAPAAEALELGIAQCPELSAEDKRAWSLFLVEWRAFAVRSTPLIGSYAEHVQACAYARTLDGWRAKLAATRCNVPGPDVKGTDASAVKWISAAVIAVALIVTVRAVAR